MNSLGAISSYALSVQEMHMNLVKTQNDLQQKAVEVLLEATRNIPTSQNLGQNIDILA